jgi:hypothetical protein
VTVTAVDAAGNRAAKTILFEVHWPFTGWLFPVKNPPAVNRIVPGWIIPMRFRLGGNRGLGIIAAGFPTLTTTACPPGAVASDVAETMSTTGFTLFLYIPFDQEYLYIWKTPTSWPSGQCRTWTLKLVDGTSHTAIFKAR